jgi:hypothetical protein
MLAGWGVDRVSLDRKTPGGREVIDAVEALGWQVNLYGVSDLESFLEAALMLPTSLTADFNFPSGTTSDEVPPAPGGRPVAGLSLRLHSDVTGGLPPRLMVETRERKEVQP